MLWLQMFPMAAALGAAEQQVLEEVNAHRRAQGLAALAWHEPAAAEARKHCSRLLAGKTAGPHDGFSERAARLRRATGARRAGENVFLQDRGQFHPAAALSAWLASDGHRSTLEGPFELSGVGVVERGGRVCATEIFLGR